MRLGSERYNPNMGFGLALGSSSYAARHPASRVVFLHSFAATDGDGVAQFLSLRIFFITFQIDTIKLGHLQQKVSEFSRDPAYTLEVEY